MKNYFFLLVVAFVLNDIQAQVLDNILDNVGDPTELYIQGVKWFPEKTHGTSANIGVRLRYNYGTQNFDYTGGGWRSFNNLLFHGSNLHFVAAETWMNSPSFPNTMSTQDLINNYVKMTLIGHNGHLGIGTKLPTEKLHVNDGRIKVSSTAPVIELFETDLNQQWYLVADGAEDFPYLRQI